MTYDMLYADYQKTTVSGTFRDNKFNFTYILCHEK